ncbi:polyamine ABC transporter substrate-binding protein [Aquipseudomonas guryensis]|uniref:Putrescine-binding periplasmic protein n=1 Tax=Aquipseudomonas guryensis TaxID=2759165 RepID=A0A7W4DD30_9GAMM|nr:polyamine ABC transporter substrate-binding protein [Pseudomonas guryensis]MBB1520394.1 polyamine ABC transporter substrate-binding protein [Pseudomonas guryensis]
MLRHRLYLNTALAAGLALWLPAASAAVDGPSVHVYNWYDYIGPTTLADFKRDQGITPVYDTFDSAEVLEGKLLTGGSGYDVVVASNFSLPTLIKAGVLAPLDPAKLPHLKHMDPTLLAKLASNDPGNRYAVPYLWGTNGIGYNIDKVRAVLGEQAPVDSWDLLFKEDNLAKLSQCGVALLDSPAEMLPVALHYLGLPPNSSNPDDYKQAEALLLKLRPHIRYFDSSKFISDLANGNICAAVSWSGAALEAKTNAELAGNGVRIAYSLPKEGAPVWLDTLVLLKDAPHPTQGQAFIDYLMRPEVVAPITDHLNYPNGNLAATPLVGAAARNNPVVYPSAETMARLFTLQPLPKKTERIRTRVWSKVKSGQ